MQIQQADANFFVPIAAAYASICAGWLLLQRIIPRLRGPDASPSDRPWLDLAMALVAGVAVLAVGQLWWRGLLLPVPSSGAMREVVATLNHLLVYSPVALVLLLRRQGLATVYLGSGFLLGRAAAGLLLGAVGTVVFHAARTEIHLVPSSLMATADADNLRHFVPVFLEGVGVAFLFVRARAALGLWPAMLIPCLLFALGHVPRQLEGGGSALAMTAFFVFNVSLPMLILATIVRSRDVVWIGVAHYVMNVPSGAFQ